MRRSCVYRVICDAVGVQRTAAELHEVALGYLAKIRLTVASVQRSAFTKVQILKTDMGKAAVNLDVAVEDTVFAVAVDRQLARAGDATDDNAGGFVGFPAPREIDRHVVGQKFVVQRLDSLTQRTKVRCCRCFNGQLHPQPLRTRIGRGNRVRDYFIRVQLLETDVAIGRHLHEHVLVVAGIKQLEQEVFSGDRHLIRADIDAAGFDFLRTGDNPCAARVPLEQVRTDRGVQPEHVGIQRWGRSCTTIDLLGIIGRGAELECNVAGILRDAAFSIAHAAG